MMPPTNHAIARRSFNDLPRELVIRIVHLAKISGELYPISDPEEYPFYKSLRLTSRLLWRVATPLLYEVVVLYSKCPRSNFPVLQPPEKIHTNLVFYHRTYRIMGFAQ